MGGEFDFQFGCSLFGFEESVRSFRFGDVSFIRLAGLRVLSFSCATDFVRVSYASASVLRWSRTCHEINSESCPFFLRPAGLCRYSNLHTVVGIGILS